MHLIPPSPLIDYLGPRLFSVGLRRLARQQTCPPDAVKPNNAAIPAITAQQQHRHYFDIARATHGDERSNDNANNIGHGNINRDAVIVISASIYL